MCRKEPRILPPLTTNVAMHQHPTAGLQAPAKAVQKREVKAYPFQALIAGHVVSRHFSWGAMSHPLMLAFSSGGHLARFGRRKILIDGVPVHHLQPSMRQSGFVNMFQLPLQLRGLIIIHHSCMQLTCW